MESRGGFEFSMTVNPSKKRRSCLTRRPPNESMPHKPNADGSTSFSSTQSNQVVGAPSEVCKSSDEEGIIEVCEHTKRSAIDSIDVAGWKYPKVERTIMSGPVSGDHHSGKPGTVSDGIETGNKVNKVNLKAGGVTHTIHIKSSTLDAVNSPHKPNLQASLDDHSGKETGLYGVPWKDFSKTGFRFEKADSLAVDSTEESFSESLKHGLSSKSKSLVKNYTSDEVSDQEEDEEIQYLKKLKTSRIISMKSDYENENKGKTLRKLSRVMGVDMSTGGYDYSGSGVESKKFRAVKVSEQSVFDGNTENMRKNLRNVPVAVAKSPKSGSIVTTRRSAMLKKRGISSGLSPTAIQFPDGLPPASTRKLKEQLSEVKLQVKRAEAAKRRRVQNEKAARESEAEAIRKILGQDSSRKKREEKTKKWKEELAQERSANSVKVASNVVRWIMGPSGTVVTFPDEIGLPSIFETTPCSYPPPREKCAGPLCTNAYKYRDSKSNIPLCSLQCYKALRENTPLRAC